MPQRREVDRRNAFRDRGRRPLPLDVPARPRARDSGDRRAGAHIEQAIDGLAADRGWTGILVGWRLLLRDRALVRRSDAVPISADASWLAFYPPTLAGVVLLIRARAAGRGETVSLLDAAIGGLAISAAGAALAFGPIVDATGGSNLAIATNLAFPLADLAIVAVMVGGLAMSGWRLGRCWTLLGAGFVLFAVSDTTYLFQIANGTYTAASSKRGGCAPARCGARRLAAVAGHARRAQTWSAFLPGQLRRDWAGRAGLRPLRVSARPRTSAATACVSR